MIAKNKNPFKGRQFTAEIILWAVRWYLQLPIRYRDLERMLSDRGVQVDHTTLFRWIQAYAPELDKRIRPHLHMTNGSWRVDETYIRVKGQWVYLYRAVDATGQTIDFLLSPKRDAAAARRFFRKALGQFHTVNPRTITVDKNAAYPVATKAMKRAQFHTVNPRTITVDKNAAYPVATKAMKRAGELWRFAKLRQVQFLTDVFDKPFSRAVGAFFLSSVGLRQALSPYWTAGSGFGRVMA
ncbi:MAG: transposase [Thermomicrobiales bacterium]|nr:transposase [Thermomicrobiales bacterium]